MDAKLYEYLNTTLKGCGVIDESTFDEYMAHFGVDEEELYDGAGHMHESNWDNFVYIVNFNQYDFIPVEKVDFVCEGKRTLLDVLKESYDFIYEEEDDYMHHVYAGVLEYMRISKIDAIFETLTS
jgi:hypothetical protein